MFPSNKNSDQKSKLREHLISLRKKEHISKSETAEADISRHLWSFLNAQNQLTTHLVIAGYWSTQGEIGTESFLKRVCDHGLTAVLPVVRSNNSPLDFRKWTPESPMKVGKFGVSIPSDSNNNLVPDIVVVPMVGFDNSGGRLGYGGGFYDRTLEFLRRKRDIIAVGIAYSCQQVDDLPTELHDQRLDGVITEKGPVKFRE